MFKLNERIRKTLTLVGDSFKAQNIEVDIEAEDDLIVTGYPNEFCQVLLNLFNNARDALEERNVTSPHIKIHV
jgi:C4-dicarboxylate-specific signal transduction histidine kinase